MSSNFSQDTFKINDDYSFEVGLRYIRGIMNVGEREAIRLKATSKQTTPPGERQVVVFLFHHDSQLRESFS